MRYIQALEVYEPKPGEVSLFLAGGINGATDWQAKFRTYFEDTDLILLNPRRTADHWDQQESERQVRWEHEHLRKATAISFWFPSEAVCATSLYELGTHSMTNKPLFIGVHPLYWKRQGVRFQTSLVRPEIKVVETLEELATQIKSALAPVPALKGKKGRQLSEVAAKMRPILEEHAQECGYSIAEFDNIVNSAEFAPPEGQHLWWREMQDWLESSVPLPGSAPINKLQWVFELRAIFNGDLV